mmetsp:Transcript_2724/g.6187  ORF Transcript_2724/g.6187 Transcript_2724/m.6187 type:complete len:242 (-) Transcript_2724:543-1268(-)
MGDFEASLLPSRALVAHQEPRGVAPVARHLLVLLVRRGVGAECVDVVAEHVVLELHALLALGGEQGDRSEGGRGARHEAGRVEVHVMALAFEALSGVTIGTDARGHDVVVLVGVAAAALEDLVRRVVHVVGKAAQTVLEVAVHTVVADLEKADMVVEVPWVWVLCSGGEECRVAHVVAARVEPAADLEDRERGRVELVSGHQTDGTAQQTGGGRAHGRVAIFRRGQDQQLVFSSEAESVDS